MITNTAPLIHAENLSLGYAVNSEGEMADSVIQQCSFELQPGERMALLGRSGSGKTTLLHACAGLLPVAAGRLKIAGQQLEQLSEAHRTAFRRRSVGVIFQHFNLVPTLSVLENLQLVRAMNGQDVHSDYPQQLLQRLDIADKQQRFPGSLSGGEQQRVAVARALVHQPPLILADEPTGNLDLETAQQVMRLLVDACRQASAALILVTHSSELPDGLDKVARLQGGQVHFADNT